MRFKVTKNNFVKKLILAAVPLAYWTSVFKGEGIERKIFLNHPKT